jgi:hypothetical protein
MITVTFSALHLITRPRGPHRRSSFVLLTKSRYHLLAGSFASRRPHLLEAGHIDVPIPQTYLLVAMTVATCSIYWKRTWRLMSAA